MLRFTTAIDLFEFSPLSDESIRNDREKYFIKRWRNKTAISKKDKEIIATTLCATLPTALNHILHADQLYLFNEHYVVKPPNSDITFRWHRDADEQLQFCHDQNLEYHSLWCPLDDVNAANGTLQVPTGTDIYTVDCQDFRINAKSSELTADLISCHHTHPVTTIDGKEDDDCNTDNDINSPPGSDQSHIDISVPQGSGVVFSSLLWHCSGPNTTALPRRVLYAQYSDTVITSHTSSRSHANHDFSDTAAGSLETVTKSETTTATGSEEGAAVAGKRKRKEQEKEEHEEEGPLCFAVPCDIV